ncbi:proline-rich protein 22 [Phalacrocorax carbo]|uniref:proline-rich protein 22 n=1 Tax=Phalacrocorax carbo TaxID=9209 RepID=UPI00311A3C54
MAEHRLPTHSVPGDPRESLAANQHNEPWCSHNCCFHQVAPAAPQHPGSSRHLCSPKPPPRQAQPRCAHCPGRSSPSPQPGHPHWQGHPTPHRHHQQGSRGLHAAATLTPGFSTLSGQAPPCLHHPPPRSPTVLLLCWVLPSGVPGSAEPPPAWAAPRTPQGQRQHFTASNHQGRAVAPAPPLLPPSSPGYEYIQDQFAQINISSGDTPAGAPLRSNIAPGTHRPTSPSPAPHNQPLGDPAADLTLPEEVPLHEALRLFGCSLDEPGISQEGASSSPTPGNPSATSAGIPPCDFTALSLPKELLSPNYSVPESTEAILSLEGFSTVGLELQEPWGDAGMELPGPQPAMSGVRGKKRGKSHLPKAPRKRRALHGMAQLPGSLLLSISSRMLTCSEHRHQPITTVPCTSCTTTARSSQGPHRVIVLK